MRVRLKGTVRARIGCYKEWQTANRVRGKHSACSLHTDDGGPSFTCHFEEKGVRGKRLTQHLEHTRVKGRQYSFGFACGSFQYGRVVTYFSLASNKSFRNSFSVSCIFARILLAVIGPTP